MSLKEQAAAVLLEYGKEIESVDEDKIRKIRSKIERNIDLGEAEISELRKVAISKDSKIQNPQYWAYHKDNIRSFSRLQILRNNRREILNFGRGKSR